MTILTSLRAEAHRGFIGPEFGAGLDQDGDPQGLTYFQIMADPKLAYLGRQVFDQLRAQFAGDGPGGAGGETEEEERYRLKLEGWADALEILLEEVLEELASLKGPQPARSDQPALI